MPTFADRLKSLILLSVLTLAYAVIVAPQAAGQERPLTVISSANKSLEADSKQEPQQPKKSRQPTIRFFAAEMRSSTRSGQKALESQTPPLKTAEKPVLPAPPAIAAQEPLTQESLPQLGNPDYTPDAEIPAPGIASPDLSSPVPLAVTPVGSVPSSGPVSTNYQPCYWIVSSRQAAQDPRVRTGHGLDVFERGPDGQLRQGSIPSLSTQIQPGVPVCIFVHGSFVAWKDNVTQSHQAYEFARLVSGGAPLQLIFFTWPSDKPYTYLLPIDVAVRGHRAEFNGFYVDWLISQLPPDCPVCLIGHSHGCRTVISALHLAGGGVVQDQVFTGNVGPNRRLRAVLTAAAVDHHWLNPGERFDRAVCRAECILNMRNRDDLPLLFYPLNRPFAGRALARTGFTPWDRSQLGCSTAKIREVDVTASIGHGHLWPEYFSSPPVLGVMMPYLLFGSAGSGQQFSPQSLPTTQMPFPTSVLQGLPNPSTLVPQATSTGMFPYAP